jgi:hypothetical protein
MFVVKAKYCFPVTSVGLLYKTTPIQKHETNAWPTSHVIILKVVLLQRKFYIKFLPTYHSALQPWVSLGLRYNQSPLPSIPHLHLLEITLNIV